MTRSSSDGGQPAGGITVTRRISSQNHERKQRFGIGIRCGGLWLRPTLTMFLAMTCAVGRSYALDIAYCSGDNTGSDSTPMTSTFQSNGLCHDYCVADYAFAVLQGSKCWCSNYIPSTQATGCTQTCPGYGYEQCGNISKGLFGYIALTNAPSGTEGPSSTTATPTSTSMSSTSTSVTSSTTSTSSTSSTSSTTSTSSTSSTTSTSSLAPSLTIITSGGVRTVTYTPQSTASVTATSAASTGNGNFFSQPGRAAGLFISIALVIIAFLAGILFFCWRRNRRRDAGAEVGGGVIPAGGAGVMASRRRSRSMSTLGLLGEKGFPFVNTASATGPPDIAGLNSVANSVARGPDGTKLVDQRLDPNQLYLRYDPDTGSSRMSVRSLRDDADYSRRVLRLANPDD